MLHIDLHMTWCKYCVLICTQWLYHSIVPWPASTTTHTTRPSNRLSFAVKRCKSNIRCHKEWSRDPSLFTWKSPIEHNRYQTLISAWPYASAAPSSRVNMPMHTRWLCHPICIQLYHDPLLPHIYNKTDRTTNVTCWSSSDIMQALHFHPSRINMSIYTRWLYHSIVPWPASITTHAIRPTTH